VKRIKLELPDTFQFTTEIPVRITDINYGRHLGNDSVLSLLHEARVRMLKEYGFTEFDIDGWGLIMVDSVIVYKSEAFYGDVLHIGVSVQDFTPVGCDFVYKVTRKGTDIEIARAKTGVVFLITRRRRSLKFQKGFDGWCRARQDD
jgi:acyl-CoA thioester hydrolase